MEWFAQNIYWTLAEDLKLPKHGRKYPYYWVKQMVKRDRAKQKRKNESGQDQHSWEGAMKKRGKAIRLLTRRQPNWQGHRLGRRKSLKASEKNAVVGLRRAKQRKTRRSSVPLPCAPQPETLRWGQSTKSWALEVSYLERTRVGFVETAWGG